MEQTEPYGLDNEEKNDGPMKSIVFLDTNTINSDSLTQLFGCRGKLETLSKYATLIIPRAVFDELIKHKKEHFNRVLPRSRKVRLPRI